MYYVLVVGGSSVLLDGCSMVAVKYYLMAAFEVYYLTVVVKYYLMSEICMYY